MKYIIIIISVLIYSVLLISCSSTDISGISAVTNEIVLDFIEERSDIHVLGKSGRAFFTDVEKDSTVATDFEPEIFVIINSSFTVYSPISDANSFKADLFFQKKENIAEIKYMDISVPSRLTSNIFSNTAISLNIIYNDGKILTKKINSENDLCFIPAENQRDDILKILETGNISALNTIYAPVDKAVAEIAYNMKYNKDFDIDSITLNKTDSENNMEWNQSFFNRKVEFSDFISEYSSVK